MKIAKRRVTASTEELALTGTDNPAVTSDVCPECGCCPCQCETTSAVPDTGDCPYTKAIDNIKLAIDALCEVAKDDPLAKESIANLSVVLFDLKC